MAKARFEREVNEEIDVETIMTVLTYSREELEIVVYEQQ